ncbi:Uncharacterised protein [Mycobacteroides abscessus subsp. abscessus]|nr:Uncharacterised protein [Mycobacteroides abscessus subsp. abscessus]
MSGSLTLTARGVLVPDGVRYRLPRLRRKPSMVPIAHPRSLS